MTRAQQPPVESAASDALAADSRERAVRALFRHPPLRRLWGAQFVGAVADVLALLVLVLLAMQVATQIPVGAGGGADGGGTGGSSVFGQDYRGAALAIAAVFATRLLATALFGTVLLRALSSLTASSGLLDRRWTMIVADAVRASLLIVAPLWIVWTPGNAFALILVTVFVAGVAERFWTVCRDGVAPGLLPAPPLEGAAVRPLPDQDSALRRLWLRSGFAALPVAAAGLVAVTLVSNLLGSGIDWFHQHQAALASYAAAGLFAASLSVLSMLELPGGGVARPRSPLYGLARPRTPRGVERGRTGVIPLLVLACATVAGAIAASVALAVLRGRDLGGGPVSFGLLVLALTGGTAIGIRWSPRVLPAFSRRRLFALAIAVTGLAVLASGLVSDPTTVLGLTLLTGVAAGVAAHTGHTLLDQETESARRTRITEHLHAVVRVVIALCAVAAPVLAALIGPHRVQRGAFVFSQGGAAFALMLVGALLLPVAALVLGRIDDRQGVPLSRDLREALLGGSEPRQAPAPNGFFIVLEGGDGAGKSTQVEALAEWIRDKGHEVVVTREPGATPIGKRLRSILLDVSSAGLSHRAEALLYAADRAEHVDSVVRPALERGAVVISDRYTDSSVAYQGAGRDLSPTEIARISRWATGGLVPHLTVLLDVSPETARERFTEAPDRLESEPSEFHQRVRAGFLALAAADPGRYLVVDAGQEREEITTAVRHRLDQMLPLSEDEIRAMEEARRAAEEERKRRDAEEAARKAEEERRERERQAVLAKLRAEEEERARREEEEARQQEEEFRAEEQRRAAEEAQRAADEAYRLEEQERQRRAAEDAIRREEQERRIREAEEKARLRAEGEERRRERKRRAEEALLRSEQARQAAAGSAAAAADDGKADGGRGATGSSTADSGTADSGTTGSGAGGSRTVGSRPVGAPQHRQDGDRDRTTHPDATGAEETKDLAQPQPGDPAGPEEETRELPQPGQPGQPYPPGQPGRSGGPGRSGRSGRPGGPDAEETRLMPQPGNPDAEETRLLPRSGQPDEDETRLMPQPGNPDAEETRLLPRSGRPGEGDAEETRLLPPSGNPDAEETSVHPRTRPAQSPGGPRPADRPADPAERVPPWLFRPEGEQGKDAELDRTRELPRFGPVDERAEAQQRGRAMGPRPGPRPGSGPRPGPGARSGPGSRRRTGSRPRPDWAVETPLDDLPSLADELLGAPEEYEVRSDSDRGDEEDKDGRGRRR